MAHFAQIDENNAVIQVIVVNNSELLDENGQESEAKGIAFCEKLFGGVWKQTSYNGNFRKNFAGVGFIYDGQRDAFIEPKPYESWVLNENTCKWESTIPKPNDGKLYFWSEKQMCWVKFVKTE